MTRAAIFVLGMHRSGTSMVTGVLSRLGARPPRDLMPANAANAKGFWESLAVARFNDGLLAMLDSCWADVLPPRPIAAPDLSPFQIAKSAAAVLQQAYDDSDLIVVKDPRIGRIAEIWFEAARQTGRTPSVVVPVRGPDAVVRSLRVRDGHLPAQGLLLWLRHIVDTERSTRTVPRHYMLTRDVIEDWRTSCRRMSDGVGLPLGLDTDEADIDAFIDPTMLHADPPRFDGRPSPLRDLAHAAYEACTRLTRDAHDGQAIATLTQIDHEISRLDQLVGWLIADGVDTVDDLHQHIIAQRTHVAALEAASASQREAFDAKTAQLATADQALAETQRRFEATCGQLDVAHQEIGIACNELDAMRERFEQTRYHLDRLDAYGWTRFGFMVDKALRAPLRLFRL